MNKDQKSSTALMVMDMEAMILANYADNGAIIENIKSCIKYARETGMLVIYVKLAFRNGLPEVSNNNVFFLPIKERIKDVRGEDLFQIHSELAPLTKDIVVTKKRISAFAGSDLDIVLRSNGIDSLVFTGISTSGVVLSTFTQALDMDYRIAVISDACKDRDEELHNTLIEKYFATKGQVKTTKEWVDNI